MQRFTSCLFPSTTLLPPKGTGAASRNRAAKDYGLASLAGGAAPAGACGSFAGTAALGFTAAVAFDFGLAGAGAAFCTAGAAIAGLGFGRVATGVLATCFTGTATLGLAGAAALGFTGGLACFFAAGTATSGLGFSAGASFAAGFFAVADLAGGRALATGGFFSGSCACKSTVLGWAAPIWRSTRAAGSVGSSLAGASLPPGPWSSRGSTPVSSLGPGTWVGSEVGVELVDSVASGTLSGADGDTLEGSAEGLGEAVGAVDGLGSATGAVLGVGAALGALGLAETGAGDADADGVAFGLPVFNFCGGSGVSLGLGVLLGSGAGCAGRGVGRSLPDSFFGWAFGLAGAACFFLLAAGGWSGSAWECLVVFGGAGCSVRVDP